MCAIYAFLRALDDLADSPDDAARARADRFAPCRAILESAYDGAPCADPIATAFADAARRFAIPREHFDEAIRGAEMDLERHRYGTFAELRLYCHRAAALVGSTVVQACGHEGYGALAPPGERGVAFPLTTLRRDLREDARRGRVYLPAEDLARFGVDERDFLEPRASERLRRLLAFEAERA